jgi:hypothetical protein
MDKQIQILLGSQKNINSVNVDTFEKFSLFNDVSEITEYNINEEINATDQFNIEREKNQIYRIYGRIEWMSLLNGLTSNYKYFEDFFTPEYDNSSKNITNSFNFYLVRPAETGYTKINGESSQTIIIDENFTNWISSTPSDYPIGWTVSVGAGSYVEQTSTNQAKFNLGNQTINLITLSKEIPPISGNLVIETNVSIEPNLVIGTDLFTISLWSGTNLIQSFQTLSESQGYKRYEYLTASSTPVTKITISANSFDKSIYMDYFKINNSQNINEISGYTRSFQVIATPNDFEIFPVGFTSNIFGEQIYGFNFKKDFDVSTYFDNFQFPNTEVFLYAQYKCIINGNNVNEILKYTKWNTNGTIEINELIPTLLNIGEYVKTNVNDNICDIIEYNKENYTQSFFTGQTFYITTQCKLANNSPTDIIWKYNPFIPIRLRYLGNELYDANTGSTTYDIVSSIPEYATKMDENGNYVWREILPEGYVDPLTGMGVDHPFLNGRRYVFTSLILSISPDLNDYVTKTVFNEIWYTKNIGSKNIVPRNDLDKIGKPCQ